MTAAALFSHDLRLLVCGNCGAPFEVQLAGGTVQCAYCGSSHQLAHRDEGADRADAERDEGAAIGESERLQRLRGQDHGDIEPPADLYRFRRGLDLAADHKSAALAEYLATLQRVRLGAPFTEAERLFHLTLLLTPHLEQRQQRAFLESSLEALSDRRHRQVLRCLLARLAVLAGDIPAAQQWLQPCNAASTDLLTDTAYRIACCLVATGRQDSQAVLRTLGYRVDDVPIAGGYDALATVLRANALEHTGQTQQATEQLIAFMNQDPRCIADVQKAISEHSQLQLCPATHAAARERVVGETDSGLRPKEPGKVGIAVLGLLAFGLDLATVLVLAVVEGKPKVPVAVNAGIWGVLLTIVFLVVRSEHKSRARLRSDGLLRFATLVSSRQLTVRQNKADVVCHDLSLEIEQEGKSLPFVLRVQRQTPPPLGVYPCLLDGVDPTNSKIKLPEP
jgi:hypothetical protein